MPPTQVQAPASISFLAIVRPKEHTFAEIRLRSAGFDRIRRSRDGFTIIATTQQFQRVFGIALTPRATWRGMPGEPAWELPQGTGVPRAWQDVLEELVLS